MAQPAALLITFHAIEGMEGRLQRLIVPFAHDIVSQPGCVQAIVERAAEDRLHLLFYMRWESTDEMFRYINTPPFVYFMQAAAKLTGDKMGVVPSLILANYESISSLVDELEQDIVSEERPRKRQRSERDEEE